MRIGIDASNIRSGGGITHLKAILCGIDPDNYDVEKIVVWGGHKTLEMLPRKPWLVLDHQSLLDRSLPFRIFWQIFRLTRLARKRCDILFIPGGNYIGGFHPFVTMSRNMLPFKSQEIRRYGLSFQMFKLYWLRFSQLSTIRRSDGIIFLNNYAKSKIGEFIDLHGKKKRIIPHGIDSRFFKEPSKQKSIAYYSDLNLFNLLYVSHIEQYKHQWHVIHAVSNLRDQGFPVKLTLVGMMGNASQKYEEAVKKFDPKHEFVQYKGRVDHSRLVTCYHNADIFIYASSCENLPNILLEAMASGLPIACSDREPMPGILKDSGVYFNPEIPDEISEALYELINYPAIREKYAWQAYTLAKNYSWTDCTNSTFSFLSEVYN